MIRAGGWIHESQVQPTAGMARQVGGAEGDVGRIITMDEYDTLKLSFDSMQEAHDAEIKFYNQNILANTARLARYRIAVLVLAAFLLANGSLWLWHGR